MNLLFKTHTGKLSDGSTVAIVQLKDCIDGSIIKRFETDSISLLNQGVRYLILNFTQLSYMSSSGLGMLVKLQDKFREKQGELKLTEVPPKLVELFNLLGISSILPIHKSNEEALASLPAKVISFLDEKSWP